MNDCEDVPPDLRPTSLDLERLAALEADGVVHAENETWSVFCYPPCRSCPTQHYILFWVTARSACPGGETLTTSSKVIQRLNQLADQKA